MQLLLLFGNFFVPYGGKEKLASALAWLISSMPPAEAEDRERGDPFR